MFHIVLDIDGSLAFKYVGEPKTWATTAAKWADAGMHFISFPAAGYRHCLAPGAIEFIQYLASQPDVQIHFYSAADADRNQDFVLRLLALALPGQQYAAFRARVRIFSKDDLIDTEAHCFGSVDANQLQPAINELRGRYKKDLRVLHTNRRMQIISAKGYPMRGDLGIGEAISDMDNTLLVDDNLSYILQGQMHNSVKVREIKDRTPDDVVSSYAAYQTEQPSSFQERFESDSWSLSRLNNLLHITAKVHALLQKARANNSDLNSAVKDMGLYVTDGSGEMMPNLSDERAYSWASQGRDILRGINPDFNFSGTRPGDFERAQKPWVVQYARAMCATKRMAASDALATGQPYRAVETCRIM